MADVKLFMVMLGCKPAARFTEQHDIFFGIGSSLKELVPQMNLFWKEAEGRLHIDSWREITQIDNYQINVIEKTNETSFSSPKEKLFFINLGGYKENEFEEYHYKILSVSKDKGEAVRQAKQTSFYKHCGFTGTVSHVDDKYGIDVDDLYEIEDVLPAYFKLNYQIQITENNKNVQDELHIGYLKMDKLVSLTGV